MYTRSDIILKALPSAVSRISVAVSNFFKFLRAWMMPRCHACARPSVEEIAKVRGTFAVAFEPDKSSAVASTTPRDPTT